MMVQCRVPGLELSGEAGAGEWGCTLRMVFFAGLSYIVVTTKS
jgi:hypothetical protein